jgi:ribonuclease P protein component
VASNQFGFGRSARLLQPDEFRHALATRPVARTENFICHWSKVDPATNDTALGPKLGFVIPKRLARLSVRRNTIKRILRECFRLNQRNLPTGGIVIRLRAPINVGSLTALKDSVRSQVNSLFLQLNQRQ